MGISDNNFEYRDIYNEFYNTLYSHAVKILQNNEEAEDLIQELFIDLIQGKKPEIINSSVSFYLIKSIRNRCLNHIRNNKDRRLISLDENIYIDAIESEDFDMSIIYESINNLPKRSKQAFTLCKIDGYSQKDAAFEMGVSINTIHTHCCRALKNLRKNLYVAGWILFTNQLIIVMRKLTFPNIIICYYDSVT